MKHPRLARAANLLALCAVLVLGALAQAQTDPLPSWNDGPANQSIVAFVEKVTTPGSPDFVPVPERIATFDNDGTLWCEKPLPVQLYFALDRVKQLAPSHPEWKTKEPFASLLKGDLKTAAAGGEHAVVELLMATHTGMTTTEFEQIVKKWIATARHPKTGKLFTEMVYQPMKELLGYLRANGFKTFSGARFMLLVLHDDAVREYAYGPALRLPDTKLGAFTPALYQQAKKDGWTVVSMKDDWKQVFPSEPTPVTAIDVLLEPDATMLQHAEANNARLLAVFPKGFALDATHRPHITMIQRFVRTADLDKVYAAAGKVLAGANVNAMKLEAFKYYYAPAGAVGVAGICAKPTPEIIKLQADLIDAVKPFTVETGPIGAFTAPQDEPATDAALIPVRVHLCTEDEWRQFQSTRQYWRRSDRLPRQHACRTVRAVHLLARGRRRLSTGSVRNSREATQGMGFEALRTCQLKGSHATCGRAHLVAAGKQDGYAHASYPLRVPLRTH
jgi:haloacid dehalogenase-like hydrolase